MENEHKHRKLRHLYSPWWSFYLIIFLVFAPLFFLKNTHRLGSFGEDIRPKLLTPSKLYLPQITQAAILDLAKLRIKEENANATLALTSITDKSTIQTPADGPSLLQNLTDAIQNITAVSPADKAKLTIKNIDNMAQDLVATLKNDNSNKAADQAAAIIKNIGDQTNNIIKDPKLQTDRGILKLQIEQYIRIELTLQKIEDTLPIDAYLKIENARVKYLVSGAQKAINSAPNLDVIHNIGTGEVRKIAGNDFTELKTVEILTDINGGLDQKAGQKLSGLQKELALQFEKRMLTLPQDVRNRKLQNYINFSYGNPVNQVRAFNQMQYFLTDREMILETESLKELALKKLENRIFQLITPELENRFNAAVLTDPADIKVLIQAQLDIESGKDADKIKIIGQMSQRGQQSAVSVFGKDKNALLGAFGQNPNPDLLDIVLISRVESILNNSSEVDPDVKQTISQIKQKQLQNFAANVVKKGFVTQPKPGYNPVSANADVRLLLPAPQAMPLLEDVKTQLSTKDKAAITTAQKANSGILATRLLTHINDPQIFEQYQQYIADNQLVKQTMQIYLGQSFFSALTQKKQVLDKLGKEEQQKLYEKMQAIIQQMFLAKNATDDEKSLSPQAQLEIAKLKNNLGDKEIPKIQTPDGVTLPDVAKLPDTIEQAIVQTAKNQISAAQQSQQAKLDLSVEAKDLGVSEPSILPGNLLYPLKDTLRQIPLLITLDPIDKAQKALIVNNQRTLEAAKLLENSQSRQTVDLALVTLNRVNQDFSLLKAHQKDLKQGRPDKVDALVNQIIQNGLARQTVFSSIESRVYGDDYVKVEKDRQDVLKNGVGVLLDLTNQDARKLTDKVEQTIQKSTGSNLREIKAVELFTEIERTQPKPVRQVLENSENSLAQKLEAKLLQMPKDERTRQVLSYAQSSPGNPVRQFEAFDKLKADFKNRETILLVEGLKDKAVQNLAERVTEITDGATKAEFVDQVVGDQPQDLKVITEIELRVSPPQNVVVEQVLPIVEQVQDIKAAVEQNIIDTFKDKPTELAQTDFFDSPATNAAPVVDIVDVKVAKDLSAVLEHSPEVAPAVVEVAKTLEQKTVTEFIDTVSSSVLTTNVSATTTTGTTTTATAKVATPEAEQALTPIPEVVAELIELKTEVSVNDKSKIDVAITVQVNLMQEYLTQQVDDPVTLQTYVAQIEQDPVVAKTVAQVGGTQFAKAVEQKTVNLENVAVQEQTQLQTAVAKVEQEIFQSPVSSPSVVEQTLPQSVQTEIVQIKQEVAQEQIPPVTVSVRTTESVTTPAPAAVSTPTQTPPEQTSAPQQSAPASAPAPETPAAAAPGL